MSVIRTTKRKLIVILLLAVFLRVGAAFYLGNEVTSLPGTADQVSYHTLALRVLDGHGFTFGERWWPGTAANTPTAHWSYLYTFYLIIVYTVFGPNPLVARLIQAVIVGLLQPYLAFQIASQIAPDNSLKSKEKIPLLAAGITSVYIYFIYYAATLMTEPFYITAVMAGLALTITLTKRLQSSRYKQVAIALGVVLGTAVLLRQLILLMVPFLFLWLALVAYKTQAIRRAIISMAIATVVIILFIIPFTIFNFGRFDRLVLLNTNAGYAFFWANHPIYGTHFEPASEMGTTYQELVPDELRDLDEAALEQELLKLGIQFVVDEPVRYLRLSLSRIPAYFKFWPDSASGTLSNASRLGSFALFLPFMVYGLIRPFVNSGRSKGEPFFTRRHLSTPIMLLYLFLIAYSAIHILSWAQVRYRLPVDAVLVIFAALAITDLIQIAAPFLQRRKVKEEEAIINSAI